MQIHNRDYLLHIRRRLRQKETKAEKIFWQHVRNKKFKGLKFKRQHSICNYVVDFYCASQKLIIELDGEIHDTELQNIKDKIRDENLKALGFKILRFRNEKIIHALDLVKESIIKSMESEK